MSPSKAAASTERRSQYVCVCVCDPNSTDLRGDRLKASLLTGLTQVMHALIQHELARQEEGGSSRRRVNTPFHTLLVLFTEQNNRLVRSFLFWFFVLLPTYKQTSHVTPRGNRVLNPAGEFPAAASSPKHLL